MDFELNKTQKDIQKAVRDFAKGEFDKALALELDKKQMFPLEIWQKAGELGLIGVHFPEEYAGQGLGCFEAILVSEELCRRDATIGSAIALSSFAAEIVLRWGSAEMKNKYLRPVAEGRIISTGAFREANHHREFSPMNTAAEKNTGEWIINGAKTFVTNGGLAGFYSVICQTDPHAEPLSQGMSIILVEAERKGVAVTNSGQKMGSRMIPTADVTFKNVRVPVANLIGEQGKGFSYAHHFFDERRIQLAAQALGTAQGAWDRAVDYVKKREQFGKKVAQFQITRQKLADMATKIELARLITYKAAWNFDRGRMDSNLIAMAKMYAARTAVEVADEAIQLLGGYGYMSEYEVERFYRDAKITELDDEPREVLGDIIASAVIGRIS
jgi:alkylation response protein AidB-like acyl-CoA dehydrogenase